MIISLFVSLYEEVLTLKMEEHSKRTLTTDMANVHFFLRMAIHVLEELVFAEELEFDFMLEIFSV